MTVPLCPGVLEDARGGLAAEELGTAEVQHVGSRDAVEVDVVGGVGAVGADAVPGRTVAVGPHRQHAGRGLHVVARQQPGEVDAVLPEQVTQHAAQRVGPVAPMLATRAPSLASTTAVPPGGAGRGHPDLVDDADPRSPPGSSRRAARARRARARRGRSRRVARGWSRCLLGGSGGAVASARSRRGRRRPAAPGRAPPAYRRRRRRGRRCTATRAGARARGPGRVSGPTATEPWLAMSAAWRPSRAVCTWAASSGVPKVAYGATRTAPPEQQLLVVDDRQLGEHRRQRGADRGVGVHDRAAARSEPTRGAGRGGGRARRSARGRRRRAARRGRRRRRAPRRSVAKSAPVAVIATCSPSRALTLPAVPMTSRCSRARRQTSATASRRPSGAARVHAGTPSRSGLGRVELEVGGDDLDRLARARSGRRRCRASNASWNRRSPISTAISAICSSPRRSPGPSPCGEGEERRGRPGGCGRGRTP